MFTSGRGQPWGWGDVFVNRVAVCLITLSCNYFSVTVTLIDRKFDLVVFNPPWLPLPKPCAGEPARTNLDSGNFYPEDLFLRVFDGLPDVLNPGGSLLLMFSNHALSRGYVDQHPFEAALAASTSKGWLLAKVVTRDFDGDGRRRRSGRPQASGQTEVEPCAELWEFRLLGEMAERSTEIGRSHEVPLYNTSHSNRYVYGNQNIHVAQDAFCLL